MLATLAKMRAEIGDDDGLSRWLGALRRHVQLDIGFDDVFALGVTARNLDPRATFADMADDGVLQDPPPPYDPPGSRWSPAPSTTTTSSVPPSSTLVPSSTTTAPVSTTTTALVPIG